MQLAESYYKDAALGGEWMNLSKDEQQIVVLRAELCDMQKAKVKGQEHKKKSKKEKEAEKKEEERKANKLTSISGLARRSHEKAQGEPNKSVVRLTTGV